MTRVNTGVRLYELDNNTLGGENHEILRIPNNVIKALEKGNLNLSDQPKEFKLNKGHMKFFYTRLGYIKKRYKAILREGKRRGYNYTDYSDIFDQIPEKYMNDYKPTQKDRELILNRINDNRLKKGLGKLYTDKYISKPIKNLTI